MEHDRKPGWIETYSGIVFYPFDPKPEDINLVDIAHALSLVCRYSGHCSEFYSVAEHSVRVSEIAPDGHKLEALFHDAAEAYVGDMSRPLKAMLPEYKAAEDKLLQMIYLKYDLNMGRMLLVSILDDMITAAEVRDLMKLMVGWAPLLLPLPAEYRTRRIVPWSSAEAEKAFLHVAESNGIRRA